MPADIAIYDDESVGFIERENRTTGPAWHQLADPFPEDVTMTVAEAAQRTRADQIEIVKSEMPEIIRNPRDGSQSIVPNTGYTRLYRLPMPGDDQMRLLSKVPVTADYTVFSITELIELLDKRLNITSAYGVESMGVLRHGDCVFITFRAGETVLRDRTGREMDLLKGYFVVAVYFDGTHANTISWGPVRVVCQNTLTLATETAAAIVKLLHTPTIAADMELYSRLMTGMTKAQEKGRLFCQRLASFEATEADAQSVIDAAFPLRGTGSKGSVRAAVLGEIETKGGDPLAIGSLDDLGKDTIRDLMEQHQKRQGEIAAFNKRQQEARERTQQLFAAERHAYPDMGLLWLAYNGVAEYADWMGSSRQNAQELAASALFDGDRRDMKVRAERRAAAILTGAL